jgi:hypothetical protein
MSISRYPRPGRPIAPRLLREVLQSPVPDQRISDSLRLADLDESAWARFTPDTCKRLARAVIASIPPQLPNLIQHTCLPRLPDGVRSDELQLERRTRNCLAKRGLLDPPQKLGDVSVGELLKIPAFGKKCLVDLLTCLESFRGRAATASAQIAEPSAVPTERSNPRIRRAARKLGRLRGASLIRADDPRFGHLIREMELGAKDAKEAATMLLSGKVAPVSSALVVQCLSDLIEGMRAARRITLEDELWDVTRELGDERDRRIIVKRFGWEGRPPKTLETVGQRYGITRERVRQICTRVERIQQPDAFLPVLDRVVATIEAAAPAIADQIERQLVRTGLTRRPFDLETIHELAKSFGRKARFTIEALHGQRLVVPSTRGELLHQVCDKARASVSHWGVANVEDLAATTNNRSSVVRQLLAFVPGLKWLDELSGWFWIPDVPRNSLLTPIRKILAVSPTTDIRELRAGVGRPHRRKGFAPPRRVLLELCRQLAWCRVDGNTIIATESQDPDQVLSGSERLIFKVLSAHGAVLERTELEKFCLEAGINRNSLWIYITYSPIIARYAPGVYGLRGADIPAGLVERLIPKRSSKSKVLLDYGWTKGHNLRLVYRLSAGILSNGIVSVPAALKSFIQGKFALVTADNSPIGTLVAKNSTAWGLGPFFQRRGGEPGDYLSILFDLSRRVALAELGDVSLAEELDAQNTSHADGARQ